MDASVVVGWTVAGRGCEPEAAEEKVAAGDSGDA